MLWKYKKVYQETNENIVVVPEICNFLKTVFAVYTGMEFDPALSTLSYIAFGDETNTPVVLPLDNINMVIGIATQIKEGSLFVDGVNITTSNTTLTPLWSVTAELSACS